MKNFLLLLVIASFIFAITEADIIGLDRAERELVIEVYNLKAPYEIDIQPENPIGSCGTGVLHRMNQMWDDLSPKAKSILEFALTRPTLPNSIDSPLGYFKVHYTLTGTDATDMITVNRYAGYLDSAWTIEINEMGFMEPPNDEGAGGDNKYDVYIKSLGSGVYGYCQSDGSPSGATWDRRMSFIVLRSDLSGVDDPLGSSATTCAHEFQHAIQFSYTFHSDTWWMENCAVWSEVAVWPQYPCHEIQLETYQNMPYVSQTVSNMSHEYGGGIWAVYLWENYGTSFMISCWNEHKYITTDIGAINAALSPSDFDTEYSLYSCWRYITGEKNDGDHFNFAARYPDVALAGNHSTYPASGSPTSNLPQPISCNIVRFQQNDGGSTLDITFDGDDAASLDLKLVKSNCINYSEQDISLDASNNATVNITDWSIYDDLAMVITNTAHSGGTAGYSYNATLSGDPLPPPRNLYGESMYYGYVPMTWNEPLPTSASRTGYSIYRANSAGGPYALIGTSAVESYEDHSVINGQTYYYRVRTNYSSGDSRYSQRSCAAPSGHYTGSVDTIWAVPPGPYYSSFSGYDGFKLRSVFTPTTTPGRIIALEYNFYSGGYMQPLYWDIFGGDGDPIWSGARSYVTAGWNTFHVSDTLIYFYGNFGVGCEFRDGSVAISTSTGGISNSYYWSGSAWSSMSGDFAIRAIVEYAIPTQIAESNRPENLELLVYPNPFNSSCRINLKNIDHSDNRSLDIYNIEGKLIRSIAIDRRESITWDGRDSNGHDMQSGLYFAKIKGINTNTKMILSR